MTSAVFDSYTVLEPQVGATYLPPEIELEVLTPIIEQAPDSVDFTISGGQPQTEATIDIDGTDLMTVYLDTNGELGVTSVALDEVLGTVGMHTLTVTQVTPFGTVTADGDFEVLNAAPTLPPEPEPDDGPGTVTPSPVTRWILRDLAPGGLGDYTLVINPKEMTAPHFSRTLTSKRSVLDTRLGGQFHVYESAPQPREWSFSGYAPTEEMCNKLQAYQKINRKFWLIDHHNRAWKVVFVNVELVAKLRHTYNGEVSDWGHNFTVNALVLDQNFTQV